VQFVAIEATVVVSVELLQRLGSVVDFLRGKLAVQVGVEGDDHQQRWRRTKAMLRRRSLSTLGTPECTLLRWALSAFGTPETMPGRSLSTLGTPESTLLRWALPAFGPPETMLGRRPLSTLGTPESTLLRWALPTFGPPETMLGRWPLAALGSSETALRRRSAVSFGRTEFSLGRPLLSVFGGAGLLVRRLGRYGGGSQRQADRTGQNECQNFHGIPPGTLKKLDCGKVIRPDAASTAGGRLPGSGNGQQRRFSTSQAAFFLVFSTLRAFRRRGPAQQKDCRIAGFPVENAWARAFLGRWEDH